MTSSERAYDVLAMGRSFIDLYAHEIGVPVTDVKSFDAYIGGCPTKVSVGTRRLGLRSVLLTAAGDGQVGDLVLEGEGVETRWVPRKPGPRTSAVILTIVLGALQRVWGPPPPGTGDVGIMRSGAMARPPWG